MQKWLIKLLRQSAVDTPKFIPLPEIAALHGVEIIADRELSERALTHSRLRDEHFKLAGAVLSELSIYSPNVVRKSSLQRIILVCDLVQENKKIGGLFRSAGNEVFLSLDQLGDLTGAKRAFHHELFHCIDYYDDTHKHQDPHWLTLNDKTFAYSKEWTKNARSKEQVNGFLTTYSMTAVWEDKAELYSHMIMHNEAVHAITKMDPVLKRKVNRMLNLVEAFSPDYNSAFWRSRNQNSAPLKFERGIDVILEISWERVVDKSIYFVERKDTVLPHRAAFYSYEKLMQCMSALGAGETPALKNFAGLKNLRLALHCSKSRLAQFGLD